MTEQDAIDQACSNVGIIPPKGHGYGRWLQTDTLSGRNGKGDGRLMIDRDRVTAFNWQTGEKITVWLDSGEMAGQGGARRSKAIAQADQAKRAAADAARGQAERMIAEANLSPHAYLSRKGFPAEKALVIPADRVRVIAGDYLVPDGGREAIVLPARRGHITSSAQLIWEDGTKKFLFGGLMGGCTHRIAKGDAHWLCEGFATGLSLRQALRALHRADTVLCCFSASNIATVAKSISGKCFVLADHDKPLDHFGGIGTGEHYARLTERAYLMPLQEGDDLNDLDVREGSFAVQRLIATFIRDGR